MRSITRDELWEFMKQQEFPEHALGVVRRWLDRGDGAAVYRNALIQPPSAGDIGPLYKIASFGSAAAQIESATPPQRLPDTERERHWNYTLDSVCRDPH